MGSNQRAADADKLHQLLLAMGRKRSLRDPIASACEKLQFTHPQIHSLMWLGTEGPITMGELARRVGITEKTITGVVDRLEREKLVLRQRDAIDRRVVRVALTGKGSKTFARVEAQMKENLSRLIEMLDASDRRALFRILTKLAQRMGPSRTLFAEGSPSKSAHAGDPK